MEGASINKKKLLILDLDNTLIYTHNRPLKYHDLITDNIWVKIRPGVSDFLKKVSINYDLAVFSSASR